MIPFRNRPFANDNNNLLSFVEATATSPNALQTYPHHLAHMAVAATLAREHGSRAIGWCQGVMREGHFKPGGSSLGKANPGCRKGQPPLPNFAPLRTR